MLPSPDGSNEPLDPGSQPGPHLSHQLTMAWDVPTLLPALLPADFPPPQDPSSPHSVHSYSSRENGVEKVPLGRKETVPLSPTSMASSSSTSPSQSKDAPTVSALCGAARVLYLGVVLVSPLPGLSWQSCWTRVHLPPNPRGEGSAGGTGRAPAPLDPLSCPIPQTLQHWLGWTAIRGEEQGPARCGGPEETPRQGGSAAVRSPSSVPGRWRRQGRPV